MAVARTRQYVAALWVLAAASQAGCAEFRDQLFTIDPLGGAGTPSRVTTDTPREAGGSPARPAPTAGSGGSALASAGAPGGSGSAADLNAAVSFGWPATIPGAGLCRPIKFNGSFSCKIETIFVTDTLEGLVLLVITGSSEAQQLDVGGGQVMAFDQDMTRVLTANIAPGKGALDCSQQLLHATAGPTPTEILNFDRQVGWLVGKPQPQVTVTLDGHLDRNGQTIKGDIKLSFEQPSDTTCVGTFNVRAAQ